MEEIDRMIDLGKKNFIFLGEAGSGKSELALNFAVYLKQRNELPVHFFDLDMTKPLFRSRDLAEKISSLGITVHYEEQFYDAPTLTGGVNEALAYDTCYCILDIGGDYIGARPLGVFSNPRNRRNSVYYYTLNAYRPWSDEISHIDETLGKILVAAHIGVEDLHLINNPNLGLATTAQDVVNGCDRMREIISPYAQIDFSCARGDLIDELRDMTEESFFPIERYIKYPWNEITETVQE